MAIAGDFDIADEPGTVRKADGGRFIVDVTRVVAKDDAGLKPDGLVQARWL